MKVLLFLVIALAPFFSFAGNCKARVDSCGFYLCEEKNNHCGPKGYPLAFGFRFCQLFLNTQNTYSPEASAWLRRVRVCLMRSLQEAKSQEELTCRELKRTGFRSHVDCYVETGFCELDAEDKRRITWAMRSSFRFFSVLRDVYQVHKACLKIKKSPIPASLNARK